MSRTSQLRPIFITNAHRLTDSRFNHMRPEELFRRQRDASKVLWFDSGIGGKWSYVAALPTETVQVLANKAIITNEHGTRSQSCRSPLSFLGRRLQTRQAVLRNSPSLPPFCGGWAGYISYDAAAPLCTPSNSDSFPLLSFHFFETTLAYSHVDNEWWVCSTAMRYATGEENDAKHDSDKHNRIDAFLEQIAPQRERAATADIPSRTAVSNVTADEYRSRVRRALNYIASGDIYQLNLSHRISVPWEHDERLLYLRLREQSPAAFGAFIGSSLIGGRKSLCSVSPELFLSVRGRDVVTRPIKGTRPLGDNLEATDAARRELISSAKERAELNMIVDLERNDLGRVCDYGSVRVVSAGEIEELPTLLHRVATITGRLHPRRKSIDLLKAVFPGGSITGTPKIRAMRIIREIENFSRGPYCGTIGWIGADGSMDLCIAIRTALLDGVRKAAHYFAGSGIVADSDPASEYEETLHKAAAFFRATSSRLR